MIIYCFIYCLQIDQIGSKIYNVAKWFKLGYVGALFQWVELWRIDLKVTYDCQL